MKQSIKRVRISHEREVRTYAELWHGSGVMLKIAAEYGRGQHWLYLASTVLTAFAFEAYLNHVGSRTDPEWFTGSNEPGGKPKDRMSVREKFGHLRRTLGAELPDGWGKRPLQTVDRLLRFRDQMAHGRSEQLTADQIVRLDETFEERMWHTPPTEWERLLADDAFATRAREDVRAALEAIHERRTDDKEALFVMGPTSSSGSMIHDV